MTFSITSLTRCSGQGHWTLVVQVGAQSFTIQTTPQEVAFDPVANFVDTRDQILNRCRSAAKEGSAAGSFTAAKAFLEGKSYQL